MNDYNDLINLNVACVDAICTSQYFNASRNYYNKGLLSQLSLFSS